MINWKFQKFELALSKKILYFVGRFKGYYFENEFDYKSRIHSFLFKVSGLGKIIK